MEAISYGETDGLDKMFGRRSCNFSQSGASNLQRDVAMKRIVSLLASVLMFMGTACDRESFDEEDIIGNTQGDVVNGERLYAFYEITSNRVENAVRVNSYTTEGDPL